MQIHLVNVVAPVVVATLFIVATSAFKEPQRRNFNAIMIAGAGAAYLNGGLGKGKEEDMDGKEMVRMGLAEYWDGLRKALTGLTTAERRFQPQAHANHIDFIVWHMARDEDGEIHAFAQRTSTLWQREAWYQKLGLPVEDDGFGYTVEQVATLPRYAMADCLAYYEAVRHATLRYLDGLTPCGL